MKIGILGSGNMGRALGVRFAQLGYDVCFGAREPEKAANAATLAGSGSRSGDMETAADFGDVLFEEPAGNALRGGSAVSCRLVPSTAWLPASMDNAGERSGKSS